MSFPKPVYWRSPKYLKWVAQRPSVYSDKPGEVAHHHRKGTGGGTSLKPSDVWAVPLTHAEHDEVGRGLIVLPEQILMKTIIRQLSEYLTEGGVK